MKRFFLLPLLVCITIATSVAADFNLTGVWETKIEGGFILLMEFDKNGMLSISGPDTPTGERQRMKYEVETSDDKSVLYVTTSITDEEKKKGNGWNKTVRFMVKILGSDSISMDPIEEISASNERTPIDETEITLTRVP